MDRWVGCGGRGRLLGVFRVRVGSYWFVNDLGTDDGVILCIISLFCRLDSIIFIIIYSYIKMVNHNHILMDMIIVTIDVNKLIVLIGWCCKHFEFR